MHLGAAICVVALIIRSVNSEYMGCYVDNVEGGHRKLDGRVYSTDFMTIEKCIDYCRARLFVYAGLQISKYCFCGTKAPLESDKVPESDCSFVCGGERDTKCGGLWRFSIYKTGYELNFEYMGCYLDEEDKRKLGGYVCTTYFLTPQMCVHYCRMRSFLYAGLQISKYCFCGNQAPLEADKKPESDCSSVCEGDSDTICGGLWRNSIYKTGYELIAQTDPTTPEDVEPVNTTAKALTQICYSLPNDNVAPYQGSDGADGSDEPGTTGLLYETISQWESSSQLITDGADGSDETATKSLFQENTTQVVREESSSQSI